MSGPIEELAYIDQLREAHVQAVVTRDQRIDDIGKLVRKVAADRFTAEVQPQLDVTEVLGANELQLQEAVARAIESGVDVHRKKLAAEIAQADLIHTLLGND